MAEEIQFPEFTVKHKDLANAFFNLRNLKFDQATVDYTSGSQSFTTGAAQLFDIGDITQVKFFVAQCRVGEANTVEVGVDNGGFVTMFTLAAGEFCCGPLSPGEWNVHLPLNWY